MDKVLSQLSDNEKNFKDLLSQMIFIGSSIGIEAELKKSGIQNALFVSLPKFTQIENFSDEHRKVSCLNNWNS